jgi:DNA-directed RNA polymerase subunit RPC12/RpoP
VVIYKCEQCKQEFESPDNEWTNDDALDEFHARFPNDSIENTAIVCDDCYNQIMNLINKSRATTTQEFELTAQMCSDCGKLYPVDSPMWSTEKDARNWIKTELPELDVELGEDPDYTCNDCYAASTKKIRAIVEEAILVARVVRIALGIEQENG